MKTILLVRHAKSSWDNDSLTDIERPLNERGLKDAPFMAKLLGSKHIAPDLIVSSPAIRALTTAAYFKNALGVEGEDMWVRDEIYEAMTVTITNLINTLPESASTVMLFGHNPTFTSVANQFSTRYIDNIPTCGVVKIESTATNWADFSPQNAMVVETFFPKEI